MEWLEQLTQVVAMAQQKPATVVRQLAPAKWLEQLTQEVTTVQQNLQQRHGSLNQWKGQRCRLRLWPLCNRSLQQWLGSSHSGVTRAADPGVGHSAAATHSSGTAARTSEVALAADPGL